ncbi:MAG: Gfo/Idh/MocA family oxidoreductase [candidate division KSB1 bacterium]|nr:Gfo/Idh/MocA family oxidoreductase [candidate division KSB1 bacterium]
MSEQSRTPETKKENKAASDKKINRRDFVQGLAAVPALGAFAAAYYQKHSEKMEKAIVREPAESGRELNVALLGAGAQGQVLMNACLRIPGIRFRAVCDIWAEYNQKRAVRLLQKYKHDVTGYEDYREMLDQEKDLDAVIIATPDFWHARHTIDCLNAGLHVYCEKEMSNKLDDAYRMVMAARETGKLLQIGHQRRSNPRYIHAFDKLLGEADILGRITSINGQWNRAVQPDLGWPQRYAIDPQRLKKYGFDSMHQFRNWRWYKGLGGGPIVDLGSHQIDIYNWFLNSTPKSVMASGGTDYYDKATHEWYDTVLAIYEYETAEGPVRAFYQTLTNNSSEGYFENFLGDQGTLHISESANRGSVYREPSAPQWDEWVRKGYLTKPEKVETPGSSAVLDVRETIAPDKHDIPVTLTDPYHQPHLENFFNSVRGDDTLNCPAEIGYETAVTVLKVNDAVEAGRTLSFKSDAFHV